MIPTMILSASQPYFAPFPGFFYKAHRSDIFLILDEVQFPRGTTWITRNRFKSDQGTLWMTIPVRKKGLGLQSINRVRIYHESRWRKKHLTSMNQAYGKAPYLSDHLGFLERTFKEKFERLVDLNMAVIRYLLDQLGVKTEVRLLSELNIKGKGTMRLVEACKRMKATRFLAQTPARKYIDEVLFRESGISVEFIHQPSPVYPQLWGDFIPNLSAFDLLLNCGLKSHDILIGRENLLK
jgi:WbqC-like protein family